MFLRRMSRWNSINSEPTIIISQNTTSTYPTNQRWYAANNRVPNVKKRVGATRCVSKNGSLHMRGFDFLSRKNEFSIGIDNTLTHIQWVSKALRISQNYDNVMLSCSCANSTHLFRVDDQGILEVFQEEIRFIRILPEETSAIEARFQPSLLTKPRLGIQEPSTQGKISVVRHCVQLHLSVG